MESNLYIANSQVVFAYNRNLNVRKRVFEFEDALKKYFKTPYRTIAVPDEIDPNIPRFESESLNGHSKLQVSQQRITFATSYNDKFKPEINKVRDYISERLGLFRELASKEDIQFVAFIIEIGSEMDLDAINEFLKENTGVNAIDKSCRDFSLLYSKEFKENYFLNIKNSKFHEDKLVLEKGVLRPTGNQRYGISVLIDINTRFFFEKNNRFDFDLIEAIEKETFNMVDTKKLEDYLQGNV